MAHLAYIVMGWLFGVIVAVFVSWLYTKLAQRRRQAEERRQEEAERKMNQQREEIRQGVLALIKDEYEGVSNYAFLLACDHSETMDEAREILDEDREFRRRFNDLFGWSTQDA